MFSFFLWELTCLETYYSEQIVLKKCLKRIFEHLNISEKQLFTKRLTAVRAALTHF